MTESTMLGITNTKVWKHKEVIDYLSNIDFMQDTFSLLKDKKFELFCDNLEYGNFIFSRVKTLVCVKNSLNKMSLYKSK